MCSSLEAIIEPEHALIVSVRSGRVLSVFGLPDPRHAFVDAVDLVIREMFAHPCQPCLRIDAVHFGCFDEGIGDGSCFTAADGAHEQVVFAAQSDRADAALTDVIVQFQATVAEIGARLRA